MNKVFNFSALVVLQMFIALSVFAQTANTLDECRHGVGGYFDHANMNYQVVVLIGYTPKQERITPYSHQSILDYGDYNGVSNTSSKLEICQNVKTSLEKNSSVTIVGKCNMYPYYQGTYVVELWTVKNGKDEVAFNRQLRNRSEGLAFKNECELLRRTILNKPGHVDQDNVPSKPQSTSAK